MADERTCPHCGKPVPSTALEGICPECMLKAGLATHTEGPAGTKVIHPPPQPSEIAALFPQLEILECLGRGGMGVVYKARQPRLNRIVALKILARDKEQNGQFAERFAREARALARLSHPNVVTVHDFGEAGGHCYLLMEFVDGLSLRQLLQTGTMTPQQALAIVPKICEALQYAHEQGIVHRDIKPENILLDKQGRVKIADFGIAKMVGAEAGQQTLTGARDVVGTPHYMAPEQIEKPMEVDHRADIYSLGVVFYEMLTGELPLGKFAAPSKTRVEVDVRLDEIVLRALEKEPRLRYQHAGLLKTEVETVAATPASPSGRSSGAPSGGTAQAPPVESARAANGGPGTARPRSGIAFAVLGCGGLILFALIGLAAILAWTYLASRSTDPAAISPVDTLLAVEGDLGNGVRMWRPDGSEEVPGGVRARIASVSSPMTWVKGRRAFSVLIRTAREDPLLDAWIATLGRETVSSIGGPITGSAQWSRQPEGTLIRFAIDPPDADKMPSSDNLRFGFPTRPWRTLATWKGEPLTLVEGHWPEPVRSTELTFTNGPAGTGSRILVNVPVQRESALYRLQVTDKQGREHIQTGFSSFVRFGDPRNGRTLWNMGVDPDNIRAVTLQAYFPEEDFQWVEFPNVALHPQKVIPSDGFGPVIELVLNDPDHDNRDSFLDLDTRQVFDNPIPGPSGDVPPQQRIGLAVGLTESMTRAVRERKIDLMGDASGNSLLGFDAAFKEIGNDQFENLTAAMLVQEMRLSPRTQLEQGGISLHAGRIPATWLFKTREGAMGILQITGFTDNPRAVRLRYKLARDTDASVAAPHQQPTRIGVLGFLFLLLPGTFAGGVVTVLLIALRKASPGKAALTGIMVAGGIAIVLTAFAIAMVAFARPVVPETSSGRVSSTRHPQMPVSAHLSDNGKSVFLVHDNVDAHYALYHHGDFQSSGGRQHNARAVTWFEDYSIQLMNGRSFGCRRDAVNPLFLRINGQEFDLRAGRVFVLNDDGTARQLSLQPSLFAARDVEQLKDVIAAAGGP